MTPKSCSLNLLPLPGSHAPGLDDGEQGACAGAPGGGSHDADVTRLRRPSGDFCLGRVGIAVHGITV